MYEEISKLRRQLQNIETTKFCLAGCQAREKELRQQYEEALDQWKKEQRDVDKLKSIHVSAILAFLSQKRKDRLQKEETEAIQAALKVKRIEKELEALHIQMEAYRQSLVQEEWLRKRLEVCEWEMAKQNESVQEDLRMARKKMEETLTHYQDVEEALRIGCRIPDQIDDILHYINLALLYHGSSNTFIRAAKQVNLDKVMQGIISLKTNLWRFQKELKDTVQFSVRNVSLPRWGEFPTWEEYFTYNLVGKELKATMACMETTKQQVNSILDELRKERLLAYAKVEKAKAEYDHLCSHAIDKNSEQGNP